MRNILSQAGISIGGGRPWDPLIRNQGFYRRILKDGSIGLGDSYVEGWWDCEDLGEFFSRLLNHGIASHGKTRRRRLIHRVANTIVNAQTRSRSRKAAEKHYDLGNFLYENMLDERLVYTSALWRQTSSLDLAQEQKLRRVCDCLSLAPGMRLLDIGCGWGSLAKFAAERCGASVVGVTISREQLGLARERCAGLPISLRLQDYRDIHGTFDRIVSLGMFEHVGAKNYRRYFEIAHRLLEPKGLFYLSTIGSTRGSHHDDPWLRKHIFPNSHIPSWKQIECAMKGLFSVENLENWGADYEKTIAAWLQKFESNWSRLQDAYDERFHRMWKYYLLAAGATFRTGLNECWQILLSPR